MNPILQIITDISLKAGKVICDVYNTGDFEVEAKSDNSPLTRADKASHELIKRELQLAFPDIPILSEEGKQTPYAERKNWNRFWLVDPLDGTKEFIKRNGEFTVNIALIQDNQPFCGAIYAPDRDELYYGCQEQGAFKKQGSASGTSIQVDTDPADGVVAVTSRSHSSEYEKTFLKGYKVERHIRIGSSLKFCMVAEGQAHIYYRHGPTWEWDTAAGHAIVEAAGGRVLTPDNRPLLYNKEIIKNSSFYVTSLDHGP